MSIMNNTHFGGPPGGFDVPLAGIMIRPEVEPDKSGKLFVITNASDTPMYIGMYNSSNGLCPFTAGNGIYLAPLGGAYELNNTNMAYCEIWAIHEGTGVKRVCVQPGK